MERIVLFAKAPWPGGVKTRLAPPLSDEQARELHEAMLGDQIDFVASLLRPGRTAELSLDGAWPPGRPQPPVPAAFRRTLQSGRDLGERLHRSLSRGHAAGTRRIAVLGADAPTLPASYVEQAFSLLRDGADAVLTPARDGGYVLVATAGPAPALFRDIPWGTDGVAETTRRRARDAGIELAETGAWLDVDRVEDLREILGDPARAPRTARLVEALRLYLPEEPMV